MHIVSIGRLSQATLELTNPNNPEHHSQNISCQKDQYFTAPATSDTLESQKHWTLIDSYLVSSKNTNVLLDIYDLQMGKQNHQHCS